MDFVNGQIYHVLNRGNNSQTVFFSRENYLFFLEKIRNSILPHADILAWCLMSNHFHLMIEVVNERIEIASDPMNNAIDPMTWAHRINSQDTDLTHPMNYSHRMSPQLTTKVRTLNDSIAIMLRSYTRAINKQFNKHGSLFQQHTKALCLTEPQGISPAYFNTHFGMVGNLDLPETNYLNVCFNYIHMNPVNDRLVQNPEDWEFSSYRDYFSRRKGKLVNRELAKELGLIG
jgi:putative transposase